MDEHDDKVFEAFRNCISVPKCKDCPWEKCEDFEYSRQKVRIPTLLALDVCNLIRKLYQEVEKNAHRCQHDADGQGV